MMISFLHGFCHLIALCVRPVMKKTHHMKVNEIIINELLFCMLHLYSDIHVQV